MHNNFVSAEIRRKPVERAKLNFRHDFCRISSKLVEIRLMVGFLCIHLGEIRPTWTIFDSNRWRKFNCARSTVFKGISTKKINVYKFRLSKLKNRCKTNLMCITFYKMGQVKTHPTSIRFFTCHLWNIREVLV
jgi:hypothetical protein